MSASTATDRGGAGGVSAGSSTPELVVILPVLMLLVTLGLQFALWGLASHVLSDSVAQGGALLRADGGTDSEAREAPAKRFRLSRAAWS